MLRFQLKKHNVFRPTWSHCLPEKRGSWTSQEVGSNISKALGCWSGSPRCVQQWRYPPAMRSKGSKGIQGDPRGSKEYQWTTGCLLFFKHPLWRSDFTCSSNQWLSMPTKWVKIPTSDCIRFSCYPSDMGNQTIWWTTPHMGSLHCFDVLYVSVSLIKLCL